MNSIAKDNLKNRFISRIVLFVIAIIVFLNCALFLSSCDTGIDADLILKNIYPDFNLFIVHIVSSIIILVLCF
jgi:hypothetical protein